jgi:hypothetical protein
MAPSAHHGRWIREEAAMAAITLNAAGRNEHGQAQRHGVLAALRDMIDAFVSNQMRKAAAEAEHFRARRLPILTRDP